MDEVRILTNTGELRAFKQAALRELCGGSADRVLLPGDPRYDQVRHIWNGRIDHKPAVIIRCRTPSEVVGTVGFSQSYNLLMSIRGGDHNLAGYAVCDGGLMLDFSLMTGMVVDPANQTARAEPGLRWGQFDRRTQPYRLATTGGTHPDTGIAGLTLGGGIGWLGGPYGLTCDNLLSVDIVTADGKLRHASETDNPDLFWALRGAGHNFGVVTAFNFRLHPLGRHIYAGMVAHPFEKAKPVLRFFREFCSPGSQPDEVMAVCAFSTAPDGTKQLGIAGMYVGPLWYGQRTLMPLRQFGSPVADNIGSISYIRFQALMKDQFPRGRRYYWKSVLVQELSDDFIDVMIEQFAKVPSANSFFGLQQLGNAANRVPNDATAFAYRQARWDCLIISVWDDPAQDDIQINWARDTFRRFRPFSTGGVYVNVLVEPDIEGYPAAYGTNYARLVDLKSKYDPTNFFHLNVNIKPKAAVDHAS
jgi:hypothetical protein